MKLIINGYESTIDLVKERATILVFKEINQLYSFYLNLNESIDGIDYKVQIFTNDRALNFETEVVLISDILSVNLNERKMITQLQKNIANEIGKSDYILDYNEIKSEIINLYKMIRKSLLIDFSFEEDLSVEKLVKLFDFKHANDKESVSIQIHKYLDMLVAVSRVKVLFITSALHYLDEAEIKSLIDLCHKMDLMVIFLEKGGGDWVREASDRVIIDMELFF